MQKQSIKFDILLKRLKISFYNAKRRNLKQILINYKAKVMLYLLKKNNDQLFQKWKEPSNRKKTPFPYIYQNN